MGMVKLELARAKNYTLVIPAGHRKGVAQSFHEGKEYMVDDATAEVLLSKVDPLGNDVFRIVMDEPEEPAEEEEVISLVEKKTAEAKHRKEAKARKTKARKKGKGKTLDVENMQITSKPSKRKKKKPAAEGGDSEDAGGDLPSELIEV
ncbi:hypothetical protein LCGC14_0472310 [marine sediment metagenome]|uniref:Uncharacterized protein n=1 Tax=marine sediment metagenome TaxID=412755 RepID=A0A0F9SH83_9ZZZZ